MGTGGRRWSTCWRCRECRVPLASGTTRRIRRRSAVCDSYRIAVSKFVEIQLVDRLGGRGMGSVVTEIALPADDREQSVEGVEVCNLDVGAVVVFAGCDRGLCRQADAAAG